MRPINCKVKSNLSGEKQEYGALKHLTKAATILRRIFTMLPCLFLFSSIFGQGAQYTDNKADQTLRSSDNSYQYQSFDAQWTGLIPVPADYDGDGRADCAVRHGSDLVIRQSSDNLLQTVSWQSGADKEVQNDYDGDGRVDIAVWRESNGNWYIRQSSKVGQVGELRQVGWGQPGDIPVPAFYRR